MQGLYSQQYPWSWLVPCWFCETNGKFTFPCPWFFSYVNCYSTYILVTRSKSVRILEYVCLHLLVKVNALGILKSFQLRLNKTPTRGRCSFSNKLKFNLWQLEMKELASVPFLAHSALVEQFVFFFLFILFCFYPVALLTQWFQVTSSDAANFTHPALDP